MGKPSKLSEDEWGALFDLDRAGVRRAVLAERFGVSVSTIKWQARKRGRMKTQDPLAVDHRRRPAGGWAPDHVFCQSRSGMTPERWGQLIGRLNAGERREALAAEYGVSVGRIAGVAKETGHRKCETAGAVFLPRGPAAGQNTGSGDFRKRIEMVKLDVEWERPAHSVHEYDKKIVATLNSGDEATASAMWKWRGRMAAMGGVTRAEVRRVFSSPSPSWGGWASEARSGGACSSVRTHDSGPTPSLRDDPPHEGEGEGSALVLRDQQRPPAGDWATWLFLGGRGAGKTLAGASWIADQADVVGRLALIGPTLHDVREVMIGGPSGVMALPRWRKLGSWPVYEPSRRRLRFPSGAEAYVFSAEDPESLRGPQFGAAWADEFCAWRGGEATLALLRMGLRMGARPRLMISTTPKPTRALRGLMAERSCETSRAGTAENAENLSPGFLEELETLYGGTRRAAQELEGRVVEVEGALFPSARLAEARTKETFRPWGGMQKDFERVVVGVDPTASAGGDACGIVVVGRRLRADGKGEAVVLADRSVRGLSPEGWARRARVAAEAWGAAAIVAEVNQGGEMVKAVFRAVGCEVPVVEVRAAVGKRARAEPVAALYEQGRVRHAGTFAELEEELAAIGDEDDGGLSLDRADALVWAVTSLMLKEIVRPRVRVV